jgi:tetratricopeptide (TPR) repeat protein
VNDLERNSTAKEFLDAVLNALKKQDRNGAIALAREALDSGDKHPLFLNLRSFWHEQEGRFDNALWDLEEAHMLAPNDVGVLNALGIAYLRHDRLREALDKFEAAASLDRNFLHAHLNRAMVRERLGDLDEARQAYEIVVAGDPNAFAALGSLAALAARRSDWPAVRTYAARVLAVDPQQVNANYALALAETAQGNPYDAVSRLLPFVRDARLAPISRALMRGALADAFDASGAYDEAFSWYSAAAEDLVLAHRAKFDGPQIEAANAYVRRVADYVRQTPERVTKLPTAKLASRPEHPSVHCFLLGFPRSGTTLLENVLAAHPEVQTSDEKEGFAASMREFMTQPAGIAKLCGLGSSELSGYRDAYWRELRDKGVTFNSRVFVDKYPLNTLKLPLIARIFPDAKILFAVRDPRDVVLSCFRRRFTMNASMYEFTNLVRTAEFYDSVMAFAQEALRAFNLSPLVTRYEQFVEAFDTRALEICRFLEIEWKSELLTFAESAKARAISTPSSAQVVRGIYQEGVGQWRRYEEHLQPILPILRPWIDLFGDRSQ